MANFPPAIDDCGAAHLVTGTPLPATILRATTGNDVCLAALRARSVIYCYSWTGRPGFPDPPNWDHIPGAHGSTPQTEGYRDLHDNFTALGVRVFGLSLQCSDYQREMAERLQIPFRVLSDHTHDFSNKLNLPTFETGDIKYLKRVTFVTNNGLIEKVFYPVPNPSKDAQHIVSWLRAN